MKISNAVRTDLSFFAGMLVGGLVPSLIFFLQPRPSERDEELRRLLVQSCERYCEQDVGPGIFTMPELEGLRGHVRDGYCVCELTKIDPTPWDQTDQHDQEIQDWWLERP